MQGRATIIVCNQNISKGIKVMERTSFCLRTDARVIPISPDLVGQVLKAEFKTIYIKALKIIRHEKSLNRPAAARCIVFAYKIKNGINETQIY